ncbi:MAG TPA: hypothetical protein G4O04_03670 [Anaerolineae bacterium]|nr:hypothetical protein [Anaerolineae bacterium]HID84335.1 hypothetical protein [Anaerolineales bacterium]HIQ09545.1 hypothetical protein [Anaerolineaceae bacterium]
MIGVLLSALALALAGYWAGREALERLSAVRSLETYYAVAQEATPVPVGSRAHKIRLALGERVAGRETEAVALLTLGAGLVLTLVGLWLRLPLWIAMGAGGLLGYLGVQGWIEGRWHKVMRGIETEMPTFLRTLGSTVSVTPNVLDALDDTLAALDERGPLRAWMERFVQELRLHGRRGFETLHEEAGHISPVLLLAVVEVGRLWETGGAQFADAFRLAAENQARILRARSHAQAEIDGARSTLRVILFTLGGAVYFSIRANPVPFGTPLGRLSLLALGVLVAVGWVLLQSMMNEVLQ